MLHSENYKLYKEGKIAKGSLVEVENFDKPQKIFKIDTADDMLEMFSFYVTNNNEPILSTEIVKLISPPAKENPFSEIAKSAIKESSRNIETPEGEGIDVSSNTIVVTPPLLVEVESNDVSRESYDNTAITASNQITAAKFNESLQLFTRAADKVSDEHLYKMSQPSNLLPSGVLAERQNPDLVVINPLVSKYLNEYLQKRNAVDTLIDESINLLNEYKKQKDKDLIAETIIKLTQKLESLI